jgi:hypothetical protein
MSVTFDTVHDVGRLVISDDDAYEGPRFNYRHRTPANVGLAVMCRYMLISSASSSL